MNESRIKLLKTHVRTILEYCSSVCSIARKCNSMAIDNVQRAFTKHMIGYSASLNNMERCGLLKLDLLRLRWIRANLNNIIAGDGCVSAARIRNPLTHFFDMRITLKLSQFQRHPLEPTSLLLKSCHFGTNSPKVEPFIIVINCI